MVGVNLANSLREYFTRVITAGSLTNPALDI